MIPWQKVFSESGKPGCGETDEAIAIRELSELKDFLDYAHIRQCLVRPYQETPGYPIVEARELLPSFEGDMFEYHSLPGFSLVAFGRKLDYFSEIFQYDKLHPVISAIDGPYCPLENLVSEQNLQTLASRAPKPMRPQIRERFRDADVTLLENYQALLPFLLAMDRAQVFAIDGDGLFHLGGVFASFPSNIDSELKRFGIRIGKFAHDDSEMYERNRMFVYQFLMELYGFPITSERRTSSALFARKLHKMGESFLLRVMGQSDRTLTTYISNGESRRYPRLEKIALVAVDPDQEEAIDTIARKGFFLDPARRVVIMRVRYRQHRFDARNLRPDRALSVAAQEILHPLTGHALGGLNIIKDASNILLRLNDIVRGEYNGRIVYKRTEVVENTDTDEKRLKFLYSWLAKHQRRMISYGDEYFNNVNKVILSYLQAPEKSEIFESLRDLYQDVRSRLSYIQQARRVRALQDIARRRRGDERLTYRAMSREAVALLKELQFEIVNFFPDLVEAIVLNVETILHDRYLQRNYVTPPENSLSPAGQEIRKNYGRLVSILDAIKAVRKARLSSDDKQAAEASVA